MVRHHLPMFLATTAAREGKAAILRALQPVTPVQVHSESPLHQPITPRLIPFLLEATQEMGEALLLVLSQSQLLGRHPVALELAKVDRMSQEVLRLLLSYGPREPQEVLQVQVQARALVRAQAQAQALRVDLTEDRMVVPTAVQTAVQTADPMVVQTVVRMVAQMAGQVARGTLRQPVPQLHAKLQAVPVARDRKAEQVVRGFLRSLFGPHHHKPAVVLEALVKEAQVGRVPLRLSH